MTYIFRLFFCFVIQIFSQYLLIQFYLFTLIFVYMLQIVFYLKMNHVDLNQRISILQNKLKLGEEESKERSRSIEALEQMEVKIDWNGKGQIRKNKDDIDIELQNLYEDQVKEIYEKDLELEKMTGKLRKMKSQYNELKLIMKEKSEFEFKYNKLMKVREQQRSQIQAHRKKEDQLAEVIKQKQKQYHQREKQNQTKFKQQLSTKSVTIVKLQNEILELTSDKENKQKQLYHNTLKLNKAQEEYLRRQKQNNLFFRKTFEINSSELVNQSCQKIAQEYKNLKTIITQMKATNCVKRALEKNHQNKSSDVLLLELVIQEFQYLFSVQNDLQSVIRNMSNFQSFQKNKQWKNIINKSKNTKLMGGKLAKNIEILYESQVKNKKQKEEEIDIYENILEEISKALPNEDFKNIQQSISKLEKQGQRKILRMLFTEIKKKASEKQKKQKQNTSLQGKIKKLESDKKQILQKLSQTFNQAKQLTSQVKKAKEKVEESEKKNFNLNQELKKTSQAIIELKNSLSQLTSENKIHKMKIEESSKTLEQQVKKLKKKEAEIKEKETQIKEKKAQLKSKVTQIQHNEILVSKFQAQFSNSISELLSTKIIVNLANYKPGISHLLQQVQKLLTNTPILAESQVLRGLDQNRKKFINQIVGEFLDAKVSRSKTIFECDIEALNIISHKPNILVLIKLSNNYVLGGFSVQPFCQKVEKPGNGCIFSLTNMKRYRLKKKHDVSILKYGVYFFTFGNGQIVIKPRGTVTSLIGTAQTYFDTGEDKIDKFFGTSIKEANYTNVQFHQLFFD